MNGDDQAFITSAVGDTDGEVCYRIARTGSAPADPIRAREMQGGVPMMRTMCLVLLIGLAPIGDAIGLHDAPAAANEVKSEPEQKVGDAAKRALAKQLGIGAGEIGVVSIGEKSWPDSSLGCPEEGRLYLQVVTPGYAVRLEARGRIYEYHLDEAASAVVWCPHAEPRGK
jgi:hypothetical protein